jgi:predicted transposase/invertase (TIGR01784 family)
MFNWAFKDRLAWELRLLAEQDAYEVELVKMEEAFAEGWKEGLRQAREARRLQAREEGWQEGRKEVILKMAKALLATGMQLGQIAQIVGLDLASLNALMLGETVQEQGRPVEEKCI